MLTGEHTALRAIERDDLAQMLAWRNDPAMRRYYREDRELSAEQQTRWYEDVVLGDPRTMMFAIVDHDSGELLGACGLCYLDLVSRNADLSIYIGAGGRYIDDRLAPDAARTLMAYGFGVLGLHRIWAEVYEYDERKRALFESLGFQLDARLREHHFDGDGWHDSVIYGLLRHEHDAA
jgi:RimJ/RimL family protein N-acetyltransferase